MSLPHLPVVVVSVVDERSRGLAAGATDYLPRGTFTARGLTRAIHGAIVRKRLEMSLAEAQAIANGCTPAHLERTFAGISKLVLEDVAVGDHLALRAGRRPERRSRDPTPLPNAPQR